MPYPNWRVGTHIGPVWVSRSVRPQGCGGCLLSLFALGLFVGTPILLVANGPETRGLGIFWIVVEVLALVLIAWHRGRKARRGATR